MIVEFPWVLIPLMWYHGLAQEVKPIREIHRVRFGAQTNISQCDRWPLHEVLKFLHFRQPLHQFLHLLRLAFVRQHHRVIGLHQD